MPLDLDGATGRWRILRVGFSSNGRRVAPATPEDAGWNATSWTPRPSGSTSISTSASCFSAPARQRAGHLAAMEVDSWECGIQNWTAGFEQRFRSGSATTYSLFARAAGGLDRGQRRCDRAGLVGLAAVLGRPVFRELLRRRRPLAADKG